MIKYIEFGARAQATCMHLLAYITHDCRVTRRTVSVITSSINSDSCQSLASAAESRWNNDGMYTVVITWWCQGTQHKTLSQGNSRRIAINQ